MFPQVSQEDARNVAKGASGQIDETTATRSGEEKVGGGAVEGKERGGAVRQRSDADRTSWQEIKSPEGIGGYRRHTRGKDRIDPEPDAYRAGEGRRTGCRPVQQEYRLSDDRSQPVASSSSGGCHRAPSLEKRSVTDGKRVEERETEFLHAEDLRIRFGEHEQPLRQD